jgi:hypothetical protein
MPRLSARPKGKPTAMGSQASGAEGAGGNLANPVRPGRAGGEVMTVPITGAPIMAVPIRRRWSKLSEWLRPGAPRRGGSAWRVEPP